MVRVAYWSAVKISCLSLFADFATLWAFRLIRLLDDFDRFANQLFPLGLSLRTNSTRLYIM